MRLPTCRFGTVVAFGIVASAPLAIAIFVIKQQLERYHRRTRGQDLESLAAYTQVLLLTLLALVLALVSALVLALVTQNMQG